MKFDVELEIQEEKYRNFQEILIQNNKSISGIVMLIIEKTIKENSLDWLLTGINGEVKTKNIKMQTAKKLFHEKGFNINKYNTSFASRNANNDLYWINPDKRHLIEDWYIILNDYVNKKLFLFYVPKNSINELKMRNDRICNVSIRHNDFMDIYSNICFEKYFVDIIEYESLIK